jgi:hypothetical protein
MPTFAFFQGGNRVAEVKGADLKGLTKTSEEVIQKAGISSGGSAGGSGSGSGETTSGGTWYGTTVPKAYHDVTDEIDITNLDLLNADGAFGGARVLLDKSKPSGVSGQGKGKGASESAPGTADWVESDTDEQLMLFLPFRSHVRVHSLHLTSLPPYADDADEAPMRPLNIKLFINSPHVLGFEEADDIEPTQAIELAPSSWDTKTGTYKVDLRFVKFQTVTTLVLFIVDGDGRSDKVRLDRVRVFGSRKEEKERPKWENVVKPEDDE